MLFIYPFLAFSLYLAFWFFIGDNYRPLNAMDQIDGEERPKILNNLFLLDFNIIMYFLLILNFLNYMLTHECMVG